VSEYRVPLHTAAGAFSTLIVLVPWHVLEAAGLDEDSAASIAGVCLFGLALAALALRRAPFAQKELRVAAYSEIFHLPSYLRAFAMYAFAELALVVGILIYLRVSTP
jgi:hypothetical protein